uniref:Uncharacterized protein n=1 Tax=Eutreptiella gymnastica TaxID=73025 RepID=A0A7S4D0P5_9EUGL
MRDVAAARTRTAPHGRPDAAPLPVPVQGPQKQAEGTVLEHEASAPTKSADISHEGGIALVFTVDGISPLHFTCSIPQPLTRIEKAEMWRRRSSSLSNALTLVRPGALAADATCGAPRRRTPVHIHRTQNVGRRPRERRTWAWAPRPRGRWTG